MDAYNVTRLLKRKRWVLEQSEFKMCSLGLTGRLDALFREEAGKKYFLVDWKTTGNKRLSRSKLESQLEKFDYNNPNSFIKSNVGRMILQLNVYRIMLKTIKKYSHSPIIPYIGLYISGRKNILLIECKIMDEATVMAFINKFLCA